MKILVFIATLLLVIGLAGVNAQAKKGPLSGCVVEIRENFAPPDKGGGRAMGFSLSGKPNLFIWANTAGYFAVKGKFDPVMLTEKQMRRWKSLLGSIKSAALSGAKVVADYSPEHKVGWRVSVFPQKPCK